MAASCSHVGAVSMVKNPVYHIVEEKGGIDRMNAVDIPPEEYYDALRADMESRHAKADKFVMDHAMSLEAFLDKAIAAGFSFGIEKAQVLVIGENYPVTGWLGKELHQTPNACRRLWILRL